MLSLSLIISTFCIIFLAELPDKTALATLVLSTKYRARSVVLGAGLAFLLQTVVGVAAGSVLTLLPERPIAIASGCGFLAFSLFAFLRNKEPAEGDTIVATGTPSRPIWLTSFLVVFVAEWGDLTQLATATLVAKTGQALSVGIGAVLALWSVTILAAYAGSQLGKFLKPRLLNVISAIVFAIIGLFIVFSAL